MKKMMLLAGSFGGLLCFFKYMDITLQEEMERQRKNVAKVMKGEMI